MSGQNVSNVAVNPVTGREEELPTNFAVNCGEIHPRFEKYNVKTTDEDITNIRNRALNTEKKELGLAWGSCFRELAKWSEEALYKIYEENNKDWENWCDDAVLFYCYRSVLFPDKLIPIQPVTEQQVNQRWGCKET
jgi:hypothetical protein